MCGIVGLFSWEGDLNEEKHGALLKKMAATLTHRGPDVEGYFISGPIGFGHRRLSIIDLSTGAQPLANEDKTVWVTFNGEIYNYRDIKPVMEARGHRYNTSSDTEAIVHSYEEYGEAFLEHLDGMFAFGLWDAKKKLLILARDRMGEKPLYYSAQPWGVAFASEPKALLALSDISRDLDDEALEHYLRLGYVPAPYSIFKSIRKLRAGEMVVCKSKNISKRLYWDLPSGPIDNRSEEELEKELVNLLDKSVVDRLVSDVPLGVFLSGGVDSSLVAALAVRHKKNLKTFSIGYKESSYDESSYARQMAAFLGTDHQERMIGANDCLSVIPFIGSHLDEPFSDSSIVPTYLLSQFARLSVTVAMGGDGADELFGGYPTYCAHQWADIYAKLPTPISYLAKSSAHLLPASEKYMSFEFKVKRFLRSAALPAKERHLEWMGIWQSKEFSQLIKSAKGLELFKDVDLSLAGGGSAVQTMRLDARTYFPEDLMVKVDRASMANSLEVRAPFLATAVAEFSARLPLHLRASRFNTKVLVKRVLKKLTPTLPIDRPKHGFAIPVGAWLKGALRPMVEDLLAPKRIAAWESFDAQSVKQMKNAHLSGKRDNSRELWALLMLELWKEGMRTKVPVGSFR